MTQPKLYLIIRNGRSVLPLGQLASSGGAMSVENMNVYDSLDWSLDELKGIANKWSAELYDVSKFYPTYITNTGEKLSWADGPIYHVKFKSIWSIIKGNKNDYRI